MGIDLLYWSDDCFLKNDSEDEMNFDGNESYRNGEEGIDWGKMRGA